MSERHIRATPVTDRSAWRREDVERDHSWLFELTPQQIDEIDKGVVNLRRLGRTLDTMQRDDFPLPTLAVDLNRRIWGEVSTGLGFNVMRGVPVDRYTDDEVGMIVWGLGMHVGPGVSQNARGDKLGHVYNQGKDYEALNVRGYQTNHQLKFHTDSGDVLGLMCLRRAREGGMSSITSATTVFNTILRERPEYLPLLFRGFEFDRRGEETPSKRKSATGCPSSPKSTAISRCATCDKPSRRPGRRLAFPSPIPNSLPWSFLIQLPRGRTSGST